MNKIKVSVIIPVYNTSKYISRCINSVVNQTLKEIEIICVDSNSTDNSINILKKYKENDTRIKLYHLETRPASISRNYGLKRAKGEYVFFLDSDDYIRLDALENIYNMSKQAKAEMCCWKYTTLMGRNKISSNREYKTGLIEINKDTLFQISEPAVWNKLFNRKFLRKNKIVFYENNKSEDVYFTYYALSCAKKILTINEAYSFYRNRTNSLTQEINYFPYDFCKSLIELKRSLIKNNNYKYLYGTYATLVITTLIYEIKNNNKHMTRKDMNDFLFTLNNKYYKKIVDKKIENIIKANQTLNYLLDEKNLIKQKTVISVIVPIHNTKKHINRCLGSIQNQTFNDYEVICIDSSNDATRIVAKKFCDEDNRFKYIYDANSSYGYKINKGIELAKGKYISIVDSDDYIHNLMLQNLYTIIEQFKCDVIKTNAICVEKNNGVYKKTGIIDVVYDKTLYGKILNSKKNAKLVFVDQGNIWGGLYSKKFLLKKNIKMNETEGANFQDAGFDVLTTLLADRILYVDGSVYCYCNNRKESSSHDNSNYLSVFDEYNYVQDFITNNKIPLTRKQKDAIDIRFMHMYNWNYFRLDNEYAHYFMPKINDLINKIKNNIYYKEFNDIEKTRYYELLYGKEILNKKVSIIIPIYNQEKYITECLDSVINQRSKNIEIIIINDGSTDSSLDIVKEYRKRNPNIKIYNIKHNGLSHARNTGIMHSTGDYILFLDSDDFLEWNAISRLLCLAIEHKTDIVVYGANCLYEDGIEPSQKMIDYCSRYKSYGLQKGIDLFVNLQKNNDITDMSVLHFVKRKWLIRNKLFFKENIIGEDTEILPKLYFNANKIYHTNEKYYNYRIRKNSLTTAKTDSHKVISRLKCHMSMLCLINSNRYKGEKLLALIDRDKMIIDSLSSFISQLDFDEAMRVLDYNLSGEEIDQLTIAGYKYLCFNNLRKMLNILKRKIVVVGDDLCIQQLYAFIDMSPYKTKMYKKSTIEFENNYLKYINKEEFYCYISKQSEGNLNMTKNISYENVHILNELDSNSMKLYFAFYGNK